MGSEVREMDPVTAVKGFEFEIGMIPLPFEPAIEFRHFGFLLKIC